MAVSWGDVEPGFWERVDEKAVDKAIGHKHWFFGISGPECHRTDCGEAKVSGTKAPTNDLDGEAGSATGTGAVRQKRGEGKETRTGADPSPRITKRCPACSTVQIPKATAHLKGCPDA